MTRRDTDNLEAMADELSAENARLREENLALLASNQSLREQGRAAEAERDKLADRGRFLLDAVAGLEAERDAAKGENERLEAEVERLIEACVVEEFRPGTQIGYGFWGYRWRYGKETGFCPERRHALAEVCGSLGLSVPVPARGEGVANV